MSDDAAGLAADLPGLASLVPEMRALVEAAARGDEPARRTLAGRAADVVGVFAALDLLQFVYVPPPDESAPAGPIDLIAPAEPPSEAVAWFGVDEVGYDEFRDAVTLFGDVLDVLNPPIVLDASDEEDEQDPPAPSAEPPDRLYS